MESQVMIGVVALLFVAMVVALTALWQRSARHERRTSHLEMEVGVSETEREAAEEGKTPEVSHENTIRGRLNGLERKDLMLGKRLDRFTSRR